MLLISAVICNKQIGEESWEFYTLSILSLIVAVISLWYGQKYQEFKCSKCKKIVLDPYKHEFKKKIPNECFSCKILSEHEQALKQREENG